jgi:hypothetical protein
MTKRAVALLAVALLCGCRGRDWEGSGIASVDWRAAPIAPRPLILHQLYPARTKAGEPFNFQPASGMSALAVKAENATPDTVIVIDGEPLVSLVGGPP